MYIYIHIYIYIYIYISYPRTNIVDLGGVDPSIILSLRGGILMPIGISQAMLVGTMLVGRLGARGSRGRGSEHRSTLEFEHTKN